MQICSAMTAMSLKRSVLVVYSAHALSLTFTESRRYPVDHGCTCLEFLPVLNVELGAEHEDLEVDERISLCGLLFLNVGPLEKVIPQNSWRDAQKEHIAMLSEATSSLLKPRSRVAENGFEVFIG